MRAPPEGEAAGSTPAGWAIYHSASLSILLADLFTPKKQTSIISH